MMCQSETDQNASQISNKATVLTQRRKLVKMSDSGPHLKSTIHCDTGRNFTRSRIKNLQKTYGKGLLPVAPPTENLRRWLLPVAPSYREPTEEGFYP
jgi:hypothetical protein